MKKIILIFLLISSAVGVLYFIPKNTKLISTGSKPDITTSFYPYYFLAKAVGGDKINISNITPAGAESHDYELTSGDIVGIQKSDILVINGKLEPWSTKIKKDLKNKDVAILETNSSLFTINKEDTGESKVADPHVWLSPLKSKIIAQEIEMQIVKEDPVNAKYYEGNLKILLSNLDNLDTLYKKGLSKCKLKSIITSHTSFGHLGERYGFTQIPISGISPDSEPSLKELTQISKYAKENGIKYIFSESLVSPKLANTIAAEVGAVVLNLNPLEGLTQDELSHGANYFTVMEDNLKNLQIALECQQ